jgi:glutamine amidotransferase
MIAILKYNAGNIKSVQNALTRLGYESVITDNKKTLLAAEKVIFPGVGEASSAMKYLKEKELDHVIRSITQPFLGICLGLQLMCTHSEEGDTSCLGILDTQVKRFPPGKLVPHMGWNNFSQIDGPLFKEVALADDVYYVHGYYAEPSPETIAVSEYIVPFSAALQKDNFFATQFHPEKSAAVGDRILTNFLNL